MSKHARPSDSCPCGRPMPFARCCQPYLDGEALPGDAETLMRSRYTAYARGAQAWLLSSWHPSTRPEALEVDEEPQPQWIGLKVLSHREQDDDHATVHFVARYRVGGRAHRLEETSRFVREEGRWLYVDGDIA